MRKGDSSFRYESLQDQESIRDLLKSVMDGIERGKLSFSDGDDDILLEPKGLLNFKLTASQQDNQYGINIHIGWQEEDKPKRRKTLVVK